MSQSVLIVEDARSVAASYAAVLAREGWRSDIAGCVDDAMRRLKGGRYVAVLLDLMLPDGDGLTVLRHLKKGERPPVIAVTADGSIARAVDATRLGAVDFLVKPVSTSRLVEALSSAIRIGGMRAEESDDDFGILGASAEVQALRRRISRVAPSDATVFITGESGVGKELCADAVHRQSARGAGPFIAVNCGAIPGDLLESVMFGHLKGAFTGAVSDSLGAAGAADGGTLFLDEICEMEIGLQAKLLRFLESATITPVGAATPRAVDVRIICATNRDPRQEVESGRFREDLFYRLHVLPIHAPPLRERGEDVLLLAEHLLHKFSQQEGRPYLSFTPDAEAAILNAPWPGNVRELINTIRQAVVLGEGGAVDAAALNLSNAAAARSAIGGLSEAAAALCHLPMIDVERLVIDAAIKRSGSAPKAARSLRVSPSTIYRKLESWRGRPAPEDG